MNMTTTHTTKVWAGRYEVTTATGMFTIERSEDGSYWNLFQGERTNEDAWLGDFPTKAAAIASIRKGN